MDKSNAQKRILIVGGGLAGSFLAAECLMAGHAVEIVDDRSPKAASRIAGGMFNIITGRMAVLTWRARQMLGNYNAFFEHEPFAPLRRFVNPLPIYRPYRNKEEQDSWAKTSQMPEFEGLVEHCPMPAPDSTINDPWGGLKILPCGWLDTNGFLDALHPILEQDFPCVIHREALKYEDLDPVNGNWKDHGQFEHVVFAEGVANANNPWFSWIDVHPLKGQGIMFRADTSFDSSILLRKAFFVPKGNGLFGCGSTYEHHFTDEEPDETGISYLKGLAEEAFNTPVTVLGARAGIRPTTRDRRPILGRHPEHPRLFFLNGLGTKGVLQAPTCAKWMLACLEGDEEELPKDVKISRYFQKSNVS